MIIKPMQTREEIEGKAYVHWKAWQEAYAGLLPEAFLENDFSLERCQNWAETYPQQTLVAVVDGQVVGFVCYGSFREEEEEAGEVYAIYVLAAYHGQSIGYQLMQAALRLMADKEKIFLWVLDGNARAIAFYEKAGFCFDGKHKWLHLGEPVMERRMYQNNPFYGSKNSD